MVANGVEAPQLEEIVNLSKMLRARVSVVKTLNLRWMCSLSMAFLRRPLT